MAENCPMDSHPGFFSGWEGYKFPGSPFFTPSLFLFLLLSCSILMDRYLLFHENAILPWIVSSGIAALLSLPFVLKRTVRGRPRLVLLLCATALVCTVWISNRNISFRQEMQGRFEGHVVSVLSRGLQRECVLSVHGNSGDTGELSVIALFPAGMNPFEGDRVLFFARVQPLETAGSRSYTLLKQGITGRVYLEKEKTVLSPDMSPPPAERIYRAMCESVEKNFTGKTRGLLAALIFSDRQWLSRSDIQAFREAGILHALAASGMHVGIIVSLPFLLAGAAGIGRRFLSLSILPLVLAYMAISGYPVSLVRASVMFGVLAIADAACIKRNMMNALFLSGVILLTAGPWQLFDVSFQLSFGATAGIILLFKSYRSALKPLPRWLCSSLALTLSAWCMVIPITLVRFGEVNIIGIITSTIAVPLVTVLMTAGLCELAVLPFFPGSASVLSWIPDILSEVLMAFTRTMADIPGHFTIQDCTPFLILPCIPVLAAPFFRQRLQRVALPFISSAIVIAWLLLSTEAGAHNKRMIVLHENDSWAVCMRDGKRLSVSGKLTTGMVRALRSDINRPGIRMVDLYIPHPDAKNLAAYRQVIKRCGVSSCVMGPEINPGPAARSFLRMLDEESASVRIEDFNPEKKNIAVLNSIDGKNSLQYIFSLLAQTDVTTGEIFHTRAVRNLPVNDLPAEDTERKASAVTAAFFE